MSASLYKGLATILSIELKNIVWIDIKQFNNIFDNSHGAHIANMALMLHIHMDMHLKQIRKLSTLSKKKLHTKQKEKGI